MGKFPHITFGKCSVCGGSGSYDPDASGADAATNRSAAVQREADADDAGADVTVSDGQGYRLYYYNGELMCEMCIKRKEADEESEVMAAKHAEAEEFRAKTGFKRSVT